MPEQDEAKATDPVREPAPQGEGDGGYLGFVAHEARNPLTTALWCSELLGRLAPEERGGPRGNKLAGLAHRALRRLSRLLEDHFLAERLRAGGYPIRAEAVDLGPALTEAAERAGIEGGFQADVAEGMVLHADRGLLVRALEALVAAAGREGAAVRAEARVEAGRATLRLAGAPLPPEALERPRKGAASDPTGRVLGLAMAAEVARAHGATLRLDPAGLSVSWPLHLP
jgi:signal transduction histidine kinase